MDLSLLDISSFLGLCALIVITFNFLLGMMLSSAYRRSSAWKKMPALVKKVDITEVHNWTAYIALLLVFIHPVLLLFDRKTDFRLLNIVLPFNAPHQNIWVALGVLSLYFLIAVIITTQKKLKTKLGFRLWKNIHLLSYFTALFI